jgi:Tol biopolymer transport system component
VHDQTNHDDLWVLPLFGERKPFAFLKTEFNETHGHISPNGRWMAYTSDESGAPEVYVRSFDERSRGKWKISTNGGAQPQWRRDGKELFYLAADGHMMAVSIDRESPFESTSPRSKPLGGNFSVTGTGTRYPVTAGVFLSRPRPSRTAPDL